MGIIIYVVVSMSELLSPEEMLDRLFCYVKASRFKEALAYFSANAPRNHLLTFLQIEPYVELPRIVRRVGEYILIAVKKERNYWGVFVIGVDDAYRFFCHRLRLLDVDPLKFAVEATERDIRQAMGFDYHAWEMKRTMFRRGIRVRLQGDLTIRYVEVFRDETHLYYWLIVEIAKSVFNLERNIRNYQQVINYVEILLENGRYEELDKYLDRILAALYLLAINMDLRRMKSVLGLDEADLRDENEFVRLSRRFLEEIVKTICRHENIYRIRLDNHTLKVIGVLARDIVEIIELNMLQIGRVSDVFDTSAILLLREQTLVAYHDEHKTTMLTSPRAIIIPDFLRAHTLQVRRNVEPIVITMQAL